MDGSPRENDRAVEASASEQAFDALSELVDSGRVAPGATLGEDEVAAMLGVSRTPAREAMQRLRELGLAESSAGRKTRISDVPLERVRDSLVVWSALADLVIDEVVPTLEPDQIEELSARLQADLTYAGRLASVIRAVDALALRTANAPLIRRMRAVSPVIRFGVRSVALDDAAARALDLEIEGFCAALAARSPEQVRTHVERTISLRIAGS